MDRIKEGDRVKGLGNVKGADTGEGVTAIHEPVDKAKG